MSTYVQARAEAKAREVAAETQARIAAGDAEVERKIRAKEAQTELERRRRQNGLAEREAKTAVKATERARKTEQRQARRAARRERFAAGRARVVGYVAGNAPAVYSAGIYGMAVYVAVSGQISVALDRDWPIAIGIGMAAFLEGTALSMALTAHQQRLKGERAATPRVMTWAAAFFAAAINFGAHADDLVMATVLGASSLAAIMVWEVRSGAKHRAALRKLGLIPDPPERFGWRRWVRYPRSTFAAWSLDVRSRVGTGAAALLERVEADRDAAKADRRDAAKQSKTTAAEPTAEAKAVDRSGNSGPVKPQRRTRTGTGRKPRTGRGHTVSDAVLVDRLRAMTTEAGTPVSLNRARTELGVGTGRAKRLLDAAAAPVEAHTAAPVAGTPD